MDTFAIDELLDLWKAIRDHIHEDGLDHRDVQGAIYVIIHDKIAAIIKEKG